MHARDQGSLKTVVRGPAARIIRLNNASISGEALP
jgi:hypothetical protein